MLKITSTIDTAIFILSFLRGLFQNPTKNSGAYFKIQPKVRRLFEGGAFSRNYGPLKVKDADTG